MNQCAFVRGRGMWHTGQCQTVQPCQRDSKLCLPMFTVQTGDDERKKFGRNYHKLLEAREDALIEEGREVTVVSNLNACAAAQEAGALRNH